MRAWCWAAVLLVAVGCHRKKSPPKASGGVTVVDVGTAPPAADAPPAQAPGQVPPPANPTPGPLVALDGPGAANYNDPVATDVPATPLAAAVFKLLTQATSAAGRPMPGYDPRLSTVAKLLAGTDIDGLPDGTVVLALSHAGNLDPPPRIFSGSTSGDDVAEAVLVQEQNLGEALRAAPFSRYGYGSGPQPGGGVSVVILLQASQLATEPVPRQVALGAGFRVHGQVAAPLVQPRLAVTAVDGSVTEPDVTAEGDSGFIAQVTCSPAPGMMHVEVMATSPSGPTVVANFPVWCGSAPPTSVALTGGAKAGGFRDAADAEQQIFALLNQDRARASLRALTWSEPAAAIARAHSADMRDHNFFAHVSPTTGTPEQRASAAKLPYSVLAENLAKDYSPSAAENGLMNSPGHRANILNQEVRQVGVGVAVGSDGALYVTQLFH